MKISYLWLKELTGLDWSPREMGERLTLSGAACEDIIPTGQYMDRVVVAEVLELHPVEGADKIRRAVVNTGSEKFTVICGAPNATVGQKVPLAVIGARLAGEIEVRKAKIRGVVSTGMICSERELGISDDHSGILVLDQNVRPGTPLIEHLDFDDYILDLELTPDRADSMSAIGIARDLAAIAGTKVQYPEFELQETKKKASDEIKVVIEDTDACPRFTARIIRNVTIGPSPWWVQKKLITAGIRPISNVVDITNLILLETGNPVHAFDLDRLGSNEVVIRRAREGEKLATLDGKEHTLKPSVLLITNGTEAKSAAGVMGGLDSEVSDQTTNVLLEVAYFKPAVIRQSRKHLGIITEASTRFEKGVDPNNVDRVSARVAALLHELCGGEVSRGVVDCYPNRIEPTAVSFRPSRCCKVLGYEIASERMVQIFKGLEFSVVGSDPMEVTAPTFRHDIKEEIDLIEEVARIEGYDAIPDATRNIGPLFTPLHVRDTFDSELRHLLTASGFDEIVGHGLADSKAATLIDPSLGQLRIVNPVSEDLDIMRNTLASTAISVAQHNFAHRSLDLRMFEIGKAYFPPKQNSDICEEDRLLLFVTGKTPAGWRDKPRLYDFYDVAGALDRLGAHFHWPQIRFDYFAVPYLEETAAFRVSLGPTAVGMVGQLADRLVKKFDLKQPLYLAELSISALIAACGEQVAFVRLPMYPAAPRDLAVVIDDTVRVGDMISRVTATAGDLAESVNVFDLYAGKQIERGKKSVGVAITFRSPERSLQSGEVDAIQQAIVAMLKRDFNAEIREK